MKFKIAALVLAIAGVPYFGTSLIPIFVVLYLLLRRRWLVTIILILILAITSQYWVK